MSDSENEGSVSGGSSPEQSPVQSPALQAKHVGSELGSDILAPPTQASIPMDNTIEASTPARTHRWRGRMVKSQTEVPFEFTHWE